MASGSLSLAFGRTALGVTLSVALAASGSLLSSRAMGQGRARAASSNTETERRDRARALANDGYARFKAGAYEDALSLFERAEQSFHAVTILLMVARCQARIGHVADAARTYRRVLSERLEPDASSAFREAQRHARVELDELQRRSATLVLEPPLASGARLSIDGRDIVGLEPGEPYLVRAGTHALQVRIDGEVIAFRELSFGEGDARRVDLSSASGSPSRRSGGGYVVGAGLSFGAAVAGVATGAAAGLLALDKLGDLEERCPTKVCSASDAPLAEAASRYASISTMGFVAAGVGATLGVVLVAIRPQEAAFVEGRERIDARTAPLTLGLSPLGFSLRGAF
jgi:hypothetical protein